MRLAKHALLIALVTLAMVFAVSAQTLRSPNDNRNLAPTVGTGGTTGGPTGLFTIYDGQTLRRGEYTFSVAYSNFDRDPGNVDITEVPVSFQIGLSDNLELFFNTDAYRGVKVNNRQNLSSFYLPNSQLTVGTVPAAIVLAPGTSGTFANRAVYRPAGMPFVQYPYSGGNAGTYGFLPPFFSGNIFGFANNGNALLGPPRAGGAADNFPGVGSVYGSILPGIVLTTENLTCANGTVCGTAPVVYSTAPSYLPDAPFVNRGYGQSAFSTYNAGAKWRFTGVNNPVGLGVVAFYRWYQDTASDFAGFNQMQRGASPGGNRGDIGVSMFADARLRSWANFSANVGYIYNSSVKGNFPSGTFTLLDRPDELNYGIGFDFPVNQFFQPILEFKQTIYVGGRTPNVFENNPMDAIAGIRIFPKRWFGMGFAYRYHANSQDSVEDATSSRDVTTYDFPGIIANAGAGIVGPGNIVPFARTTSSRTLEGIFRQSTDPHGFIVQFWAGRRNARAEEQKKDEFANVDSVTLNQTEIVLPCPPGTRSKSGACSDNRTVGVATKATDPEGATLTYNYTVSGGRIAGQGANVNWDLSGVKAGTYTITAAVDDGCGFCGKTETKTIVVKECTDCVQICECATVSAMGPSSTVNAGESMTFTARLSGGSQQNATYNWTVNNGTIVSGQGTQSITVSTASDAYDTTVTASVEVGGLCADCPRTASASGMTNAKPPVPMPRPLDNAGPMVPDDLKKRLDGLRGELQNDPGARGYIVNTGDAKAKALRIRHLNAAMDFQGIDKSRVTIVDGGGSGPINSAIWIVPAGAANPQ